jgi:hypothetical protein
MHLQAQFFMLLLVFLLFFLVGNLQINAMSRWAFCPYSLANMMYIAHDQSSV